MDKQEKQEQQEQVRQRDDALFEALGKSKKRKKRRIIITVAVIVAVVAIVAVVGVIALQRQVREQFASSTGEVLSHTVTTGSISTVVSGSGQLTDEDTESITVPEGVEITEVLVKTNDTVAQGDILATVDMATVKSAMANIQAQIEELDAEISDAEEDAVDSTISAGVSGRVKVIYAKKDTAVADTMYENGALMLLSLDGYMAVDIETESLKTGDSVSVKRANGKTVTGTVETVSGGTATVLVTDNGPENDEEVTVSKDGTQLGTGKLYIHKSLRVTGYAGTVSKVRVSENDKVSASTKLLTLTDTSYSANYSALLRSRAELEETLLELLTIQKDGAVAAPFAGSVISKDYSDGSASAVVTLSPDKTMSVTISVDEEDILSLELGQTVTVTVSSVSEESFAGTLEEINKTASNGYYSAVVTLDKVQGMLSGMTASVSVRIEGVDDALLIPVEALHQTSNGAYVYTGYDEQTQEYSGKVDVVTGLQNSNYVEIKSGLSEGDTVYYTESTTSGFDFGGMGGMGGMNGMGGNRGNSSNGGNGGSNGSTGGGSQMPDFGGGEMPGGNQRPSGTGGSRG